MRYLALVDHDGIAKLLNDCGIVPVRDRALHTIVPKRYEFDIAPSTAHLDLCEVPALNCLMLIGGTQKGGFQKGGFWQMFPCTEISSKHSSATLPWQKKAMIFDIPWPPKTRARAQSPKQPFYQTTLLHNPLELLVLFSKNQFHATQSMMLGLYFGKA